MNRVRLLPEFTNSYQDKSSKEKQVGLLQLMEALTKTWGVQALSTVQLIILMSKILMRILLP